MPAQFNVVKSDYLLETGDQCLKVKESDYPIKVRYEGPYFYRDVEVECTIPVGETWTIGFVQSCDQIELRHTYQSGNYTRWEFDTPISDSTSDSFPYYSLASPVVSGRRVQDGVGRVVVVGPKTREKVKLSMNDNLNSNVQWWDPVPVGQTNYNANVPHTLTSISRKQKFTTYLVAHQGTLSATNCRVLGKIVWRMNFIIDFDCSKATGQRGSKKYGDGHAIISHLSGSKDVLPACCFINSNANQTQKLVGYGSNGGVLKALIPW